MRRWEENGYFKPREPLDGSGSSAEPFVVPMPPPNVTGRLHMGHAMFVTLQDIMVRHARMRGRPTLWLPGTDHAGIATQVGVHLRAHVALVVVLQWVRCMSVLRRAAVAARH